VAVAAPRTFGFLKARMLFDELYAATVGRAVAFLTWTAAFLDRWIWTGGISALALLGQLAGRVDREADEEGLNAGFDATSHGLRGTGRVYARAQSGEAQGYLRGLAVAFAVLALLALWGSAQ
jgi:NADH-quinone oxidoreductase subunit L